MAKPIKKFSYSTSDRGGAKSPPCQVGLKCSAYWVT